MFFKKIQKSIIFSIALFVILSNFLFFTKNVDAATTSFTQTSWTGGITGNTATNASNQTGWTELSATSSVTANSNVVLTSTNYTFTDDGATSTSPTTVSTGGDFDNGTNSDTTVSGSGAGASVALTGTLTAVNAWANPLAVVPGTVGAGSSMVRNGTDDYIYVLQGGGTGFYRYSVSGDSWSTLAVVPGAVAAGASMLWNGTDDYIYVARGNGQTSFYRYSISGDSWSTLAVTPGAIGSGSSMIRNGTDNEIYLTQSGGGGGFYSYSISGNSWTTLTSSPTAFGTGPGSSMVRNGSGNDIYLTQGAAGGGTGFWKYSISGNSWSTLTSFPFLRNAGASMTWNGGEDYIYVTQGGGGTTFYRYSIIGNSWTLLALTPVAVNAGGFMIRNSTDNEIYLVSGNGGTGFYRYSITGNSWTTMSNVPASLTTGTYMLRGVSSNEDEIYVIRGGGTGFYKFVINDMYYPSTGTFTSAVIDMGGKATFGTIAYGGSTTLPTSTTVTYSMRAGNVASPDGTWTAYTNGIANGGSISAFNGYRYLQYKLNLATSISTSTPSVDEVDVAYSQYAFSGDLTSSTFDSGSASNLVSKLTWVEADTSSTETVKFQVRSSSDGVTWSSWCGYDDCSGSTYFTTGDSDNGVNLSSSHPLSSGANDRYFQYKILLTSEGFGTPNITSVTANYGDPVVEEETEEDTATSSNGPIFQGTSADFFNYVAPRMQTVYPDGKVVYLDSVDTSTQNNIEKTNYVFTRALRLGSTGEDVKELQKFLNSQGFVISQIGGGSPGKETTYFGTLTRNALIKFQEKYKKEILTPLGLSKGTGVFGSSSRNFVNGFGE